MSQAKKEFLTFILGKEEFAVEILRVQEIRGWQKPNPLPNVPEYVKGVVDLRGTVVPIIDLRQKFKLAVTYDATTVVIVVHVLTKQGERVVGLVVDGVSDVHEFDMNQLQPAPDISNTIANQYIMGLTTKKANEGQSAAASQREQEASKNKGSMVIVVDLDKLTAEGIIEQIVLNTDNMPTGNG